MYGFVRSPASTEPRGAITFSTPVRAAPQRLLGLQQLNGSALHREFRSSAPSAVRHELRLLEAFTSPRFVARTFFAAS